MKNYTFVLHLVTYCPICLSKIFTFFLYLSWSNAGVYPNSHPVPIILPDASLRSDGGDVPLPLMRLMR
jgi:hypothetical protein